MNRLTFICLIALLAGCPPDHVPDPVPPPPAPAPVPTPPKPPRAATCADACDNAAQLRCSFAEPTPHGTSCVEVCENAQTFEHWDLECMRSAGSCSAWDDCPP